VPHSVKVQNDLGDEVQVIFVESQGHSIEEAEQCALQHKWFSDRAIWTTEQPFETGAKGIPHTVLLGNNGEVLYNGSPSSQVEDLIAEQVKLAKKGPKDLSPTCTKAWQDFEKGNWTAAIKSLDAVQDGAEKDAATKLSAQFTARANAKVTHLQWLVDNSQFDRADKLAPNYAKAVAGNEKLEARVKEITTKLASQEIASEREASKALDKIEARIAKDGLDAKSAPGIVKALNGVSEKFPKTTAAKRAEHLAKLAQMPSS